MGQTKSRRVTVFTPKERDIAKDFTSIFRAYQLWIPNNTTESGWPDRLIQCDNSLVVACELKRVYVNLSNEYSLGELRQEQCAWLAKWQRKGGKCLVFAGLIRFADLVGFHCITKPEWGDWLQANKVKYSANNIMSDTDVVTWFKEYVIA